MPEPADYSEAEKGRLWAHRLHEDVILSDRQSFFLVAQSLLLVALAELLGADERLAAAIVAGAGVLLTAGWLYVNLRQHAIVRHLQRQAEQALPEFAATYSGRPRGPSSTMVLVRFVPGLLGAVWILLLVVVVT